MIKSYTKKPVVIQALQWTGSNLEEIITFTDGPPDVLSEHADMKWEEYKDLVAVPRDLIGAACSAIDKKRDGARTLAELRRYTVGDLSAAITSAPHAASQPCDKGLVEKEGLKIYTLEGKMNANVGDYIIKGVRGEFYPCKQDIFEETYSEV